MESPATESCTINSIAGSRSSRGHKISPDLTRPRRKSIDARCTRLSDPKEDPRGRNPVEKRKDSELARDWSATWAARTDLQKHVTVSSTSMERDVSIAEYLSTFLLPRPNIELTLIGHTGALDDRAIPALKRLDAGEEQDERKVSNRENARGSSGNWTGSRRERGRSNEKKRGARAREKKSEREKRLGGRKRGEECRRLDSGPVRRSTQPVENRARTDVGVLQAFARYHRRDRYRLSAATTIKRRKRRGGGE